MKRRRETDGLEEEIRDHIERETAENIDRGMTPEAARLAARRKFGNVTRATEEAREVWRMVWLDQLAQDAGLGLRILRRNPRFAVVAVAALALGIGINTAVFSVVNAVLLRPLAYPHPERLVWLADHDPHIDRDFADIANFFEWRRYTMSYSGMAAYGYLQAALGTPRGAGYTTAIYAAGDFWKLTGARAVAGRLCGEDEPDCVVLSWGLFERLYGADSRVLGGATTVNGRAALLAGVLPRDFRVQLPMWWIADHPEPVEAFVSLPPPRDRMAQSGQVFASLKPGIRIAQAQAELEALQKRLEKEGGHRGIMTRLRVQSLAEKLSGGSRRALLVLLAAGCFVLLIACVNVASLLLARAAARRKEIAIRTAIGAGRMRVFRQLVVESAWPALAGGAVGLLLARWAVAVLVRTAPYAIQRMAETTIDGRVAFFTLAVSLLAAVLFGAGSAVACRRANLLSALKEGARGGAGLLGAGTRRVLMTVELTLAIVLLIGAGLMWKSLVRMNQRPPGFAPERTVVMKVRLAGPRYRAKPAQDAFVREVLRRLAASGLSAAGVSTWFLFDGAPAFPVDSDPATTHVIRVNACSTGYLEALGMKLVRGRWLNENDDGVLLNESMARQAFGRLDPIGREIAVPQRSTVVGIVADLKYFRPDAAAAPESFVNWQSGPGVFNLEIAARTAGDPHVVVRELEKQLAEIDPAQPVYDARTLEEALAATIAPRRLNLLLLGGFALVALAMAIVGIYGVMAYAVAERTREIGVRMALGARRGQVIAMVAREAGGVAAVGIGAGLLAAWGATRVMAGLLYGVAPNDPVVFAGVAVALGLTVLAACVGPALRASWVDPAIALRAE
ncbi:MAG: ABC transporter permease [Acidobacteria bacterium]|nr:ABC transporter permease [Acidobacteriota bacterium]